MLGPSDAPLGAGSPTVPLKTLRVFISSTAEDFAAERDVLATQVFPELTRRVAQLGAMLVRVDPRWGKDASVDEDVFDLARRLNQVDAARPYFIGLLGESYGPQAGQLPLELRAKYPWLAPAEGTSVTDLEMQHAALSHPDPAAGSFFYLRDSRFLADLPPELEGRFTEHDPVALARLAELKRRIKASGRPVMEGYPCHWDAERGTVAGLELFAQRVLEDLWVAIATSLEAPPPETAVSPPPIELPAPPLPREIAIAPPTPAVRVDLDDTHAPPPPAAPLPEAPPPPPVFAPAPAVAPPPVAGPPPAAPPPVAGPPPVAPPPVAPPPVAPPPLAAPPAPPAVAAPAPAVAPPAAPAATSRPPAKPKKPGSPWLKVAGLLLSMVVLALVLGFVALRLGFQAALPGQTAETPPMAEAPDLGSEAGTEAVSPEAGAETSDLSDETYPTLGEVVPEELPVEEALPAEKPAAGRRPAPIGARPGSSPSSEPASQPAPRPAAGDSGGRNAPAAPSAAEEAAPIVPPRLLKAGSVRVPPSARRLREEVIVEVRVLVGPDGSVLATELASAPAGRGLDEAALDAARRGRYQPATQAGQPIQFWTTLKVRFRG